MERLKIYSEASPYYVLYELLDRMEYERNHFPTVAEFLLEFRKAWINEDLDVLSRNNLY